MLGSRRLLVIGVVVVALLVIAVLITVLTGGTRDKADKTCATFMTYISKQDVKSAYAMLSDDAKKSSSYDSWRSLIIGLANVYKDADFRVADNRDDYVRGTSDTDKGSTRKEYDYTIRNAAATSHASCYTIPSSKGPLVDGFSSITD